MSKHWWWLLAVGLTACGGQVAIAPSVALKHEHDANFKQLVTLLGAEQVKVAASPPSVAGPARASMLTLEVINPRSAPGQHPDTLRQRLRKLAHLLVADLASPGAYQVMSAQATFRPGLLSPRNSSSSQTFIYLIANLR